MRPHFIAAAAPMLLALMPLTASAEEPAPKAEVPEVCRLTVDSAATQRRACLEKEWNDYLALQKQLDEPRIRKHKESVKKMEDAVRDADREARALLEAKKITQEEFERLELEIQMRAMLAGLSLGFGGDEPGGCANPYDSMGMVTSSLLRESAPITDRALGILFSGQSLAACFAAIAKNPASTPDMVSRAKRGEAVSLLIAGPAEQRWCAAFLKNPDDPAWQDIFGGNADYRKAEQQRCALTLNPGPKAP